MNVQVVLLRGVKQPDQADRILPEEIFRRDRQPLALDDKTIERAPAKQVRGAPAQPRHAPLALLVGLEDRAEDARQVADILRDQEIVFHEPLDAARPGMVGVAHAGADPGLHVERQTLLGPPGEVVQVAAHRPQKALRPLEALRFLGRQHAQFDELCDVVDTVDVLGDPEQRVQVAKPALTLLDVGFELIAAVADADMPRVALGELGVDELRRGAAQDLGLEALLQLVEEGLLAPNIARLQERGADRQIGLGVAQAVLDRASRLPDLQPQIP
jgi:hypothetical protein